LRGLGESSYMVKHYYFQSFSFLRWSAARDLHRRCPGDPQGFPGTETRGRTSLVTGKVDGLDQTRPSGSQRIGSPSAPNPPARLRCLFPPAGVASNSSRRKTPMIIKTKKPVAAKKVSHPGFKTASCTQSLRSRKKERSCPAFLNETRAEPLEHEGFLMLCCGYRHRLGSLKDRK
jgi:hypothetical protein